MSSDPVALIMGALGFLAIGFFCGWLPARREARRIEDATWRAARRFYANESDRL